MMVLKLMVDLLIGLIKILQVKLSIGQVLDIKIPKE
jgi:hypothetical protein